LAWRPNGEAQPPADGGEVVERYSEQHTADFQKRHDSAGRLERNVGPPNRGSMAFYRKKLRYIMK